MDKNVYETYEFLQSTSSGSNSNQLFVLQDDGTILTVHKEIQFIAQSEDVDVSNLNPTPTDHSTMFINPPQQYYVEFEGNTPELISLNDQYSLASEENNVYENHYILQSHSTTAPQEMETEEVIDPQKLDAQQMQQLNIEAFNGTKQNTDLSEITLTDEQYQILEQKGWLLLEANNKVFVLNTQGLHDITDNDKLVQRLKSELLENNTEEVEKSKTKVQNQNETEAKDSSNVVEFFIQNNNPVHSIDNTQLYITSDHVDEEINVDVVKPGSPVEKPEFAEEPVLNQVVLNDLIDTKGTNELPKKCDTIKIKTKYKFTDIPDKIFLGKTVNGKNLVAKVKMKVSSLAKAVDPLANKNKLYEDSSVLDPGIFINLIQTWFRRSQVPNVKSVRFAETVITQLVRLPNLTDCIVQGNLVVTKIVTNHTSTGLYMEQPTIVTGFMATQDNDYVFNHAPSLLRDILQEAEEQAKESSSNAAEKRSKGLIEIFHIHVSELKFQDKPPKTAIHLSKRKIPIEPLKDAKKKYPNPALACAVCGSVFQSEAQLKDHQDDECIEVDDSLTIDADNSLTIDPDNSNSCGDKTSQSTLYTVLKNGNEKTYTCKLCDTKFTRLFSCKKHVKAHQEGKEKKLKVYKCKMCASSYFHPATLSKHILKAHIQKKLKS